MMDIVMLVAGAGVGAMLRDLFVLHRGGECKTRQQLESKTPYDYALTSAISERDRLQEELRTIRALKRTEADTERIRNEIGTILSDCGEEASEDVYEPNIGLPIQDNGDGTFSPITWDNRISSGEMVEIFGYRGHPIIVNPASDGREYMDNVREDDSEDEQSTEFGEGRSYNHSVGQAFRDRTFVRVFCTGGRVAGEVTAFAFEYGELTELQLNGIDVSIPEIIEIRKGADISGETLYRKGNR